MSSLPTIMIAFPEFSLKMFSINSAVLVVGARGSGKSTILSKIMPLGQLSKDIVMINHPDINHYLKVGVPSQNILRLNHLQMEKEINKIMETQRLDCLVEQQKEKATSNSLTKEQDFKKQCMTLVLDSYHNFNHKYGKLINNSRNFNITLGIDIQSVRDFSADLRGGIDWVVICRTSEDELKRIYLRFGHLFSSIEMFMYVAETAIKQCGCLILNMRSCEYFVWSGCLNPVMDKVDDSKANSNNIITTIASSSSSSSSAAPQTQTQTETQSSPNDSSSLPSTLLVNTPTMVPSEPKSEPEINSNSITNSSSSSSSSSIAIEPKQEPLLIVPDPTQVSPTTQSTPYSCTIQ
jgi:hypothetical protein